LAEWWRGWFLSGFSWLSLGYSQTDTWLNHLAPVLGVYGITAALLICAGALTTLVLGSLRTRIVAVAVVAVVWLAALGLGSVEWTHPAGQPVTVAVVQGSIPQDQKWLDSNRKKTLDLYQRLTETALGTRLIVWPEAAPPELANKLVPWITALYREAQALLEPGKVGPRMDFDTEMIVKLHWREVSMRWIPPAPRSCSRTCCCIGNAAAILKVQFPRAAVIVQTIRDIRILLYLADCQTGADCVDRAGRDKDNIARLKRTPV